MGNNGASIVMLGTIIEQKTKGPGSIFF